MDRHDPHAFSPFFENWRLGSVFGSGLGSQLVDETSERGPSPGFKAPCQIPYTVHIGEDLIAGRPQREGRVCPARFQQLVERFDERLPVAPPVQAGEYVQGFGDRFEFWVDVVEAFSKRVQGADGVAIPEQQRVGDGKQRSLQRRVDRELVIRPFDRGQRSPDRLDLLPLVERLGSPEQVGDVAGLQGVDVAAGDVLSPR